MKPALVQGQLSMTGPFAMAMYLPAMPEIATEPGNDAQAMQAAITAYLVAFGLAQPVYGPWADQAGRKPLLYFASVVFAVGSVLMALDPLGEIGRLAPSLGGTFQMIAGAAVVALAGSILDGRPAPMIGLIAACARASMVLAFAAPEPESLSRDVDDGMQAGHV